MTSSLVPFHVTPHAERFPTSGVGTFERFFSRVRVAVDPQAGRSRKRLVARLTHVPILRLARECGGR